MSQAVVVATGVSANGRREVLGHAVGDSKTEPFWTEFVRSLRDRGLAGVQLVISDAHRGLVKAIAAVLHGAAWQRCRVHFPRNVLVKVGKGDSEMVVAAVRTIFAQPTGPLVRAQVDVARLLEGKFPSVAAMLLEAKTNLTAFADFPEAHWKKLWSTNPLERLSKEIKRAPTSSACSPTRPPAPGSLASAVLVEAHDEWQATAGATCPRPAGRRCPAPLPVADHDTARGDGPTRPRHRMISKSRGALRPPTNTTPQGSIARDR